MEKKITAIYAQKHNKDRVNIDLDGEFAFGLSRIIAAWLKIGDFLSDEKINKLLSEDEVEVAYQKALLLIDYRPRTENEIRQRLSQKEFQPEVIENVLEKLRNAKLVHDEQYAKMWVENRNQFHPRGKRLIRYELKNKGISEDVINIALAESEDETQMATQAATRYAEKIADLDWLEFRKRLSAFLSRRGFSYGTIAQVVQAVWDSMNSATTNNIKNEEVYYAKSNPK